MHQPVQFEYNNIQEQFDKLIKRLVHSFDDKKEYDLFVTMRTFHEMSNIPGIDYRSPDNPYGGTDERPNDYCYYGRYYYHGYTFNLYIVRNENKKHEEVASI